MLMQSTLKECALCGRATRRRQWSSSNRPCSLTRITRHHEALSGCVWCDASVFVCVCVCVCVCAPVRACECLFVQKPSNIVWRCSRHQTHMHTPVHTLVSDIYILSQEWLCAIISVSCVQCCMSQLHNLFNINSLFPHNVMKSVNVYQYPDVSTALHDRIEHTFYTISFSSYSYSEPRRLLRRRRKEMLRLS